MIDKDRHSSFTVVFTVTFNTAITFLTGRPIAVLLSLTFSLTVRRVVVLRFRLVAVRAGIRVGVAVAVGVRAALGGVAARVASGRHHLLELSDGDLPGHYLPEEFQRVVRLHLLRQMFVIQGRALVALQVRLLC